jgi:methylase of polypeptide subunit release factors
MLSLAAKQGGKLQNALQAMERGDFFEDLGFERLWDEDFFHWYTLGWDRELEEVLSSIIDRFSIYNSFSVQASAEECGDLLKKLYHRLLPREIRYYLGEYYTPDWLADVLTRKTLGDDLGDGEKRVLDPACGSGTFLVAAIRHIRAADARRGVPQTDTLQKILNHVVGYDLNPLAVLAARVNYLFALGDLVHHSEGLIQIPVLLYDSIFPRESMASMSEGEESQVQRFDYVLGNPPWVNWEHLPDEYRKSTVPLWQHYGLFPKRAKGMDTILGGAKYDFSMLMTCVALDRYLKPNGKLGFVITESLFKTTEAGQGFRRFVLPDGTPFRPILVENMSDLKPFEKALNRTAIAVFQKGKKVSYPVPYAYWCKAATVSRLKIDYDLSYEQFPFEKVVVRDWEAHPIDAGNLSSIWITGRPNAVKALPHILGKSPYKAREGVNTGGANGVYWVKEEGRNAAGMIKIENMVHCSKKTLAQLSFLVEADLLYPLLRACNVRRWAAEPEARMIVTHEPDAHLRAISEPNMKNKYPRTYAYLMQFEGFLRSRKTQVVRNLMSRGPFYSIFGIGEYSFAPWKVVWTRIAKVEAAVIGVVGDKPILPQETLTMVDCQSEMEAHYLAAVINSTPFQFTVNAYSQRGGKSMGSQHILRYIHVPRFDQSNPIHQHMAAGSMQAHATAKSQHPERVSPLESEINRWAGTLWNLSELDIEEIEQSYQELQS